MSKNKKNTDIDVNSTEENSSIPAFQNPQNRFQGKKTRSVSEYVEGILKGDRILLSQAITLVESNREEHLQLAGAILEKLATSLGHGSSLLISKITVASLAPTRAGSSSCVLPIPSIKRALCPAT